MYLIITGSTRWTDAPEKVYHLCNDCQYYLHEECAKLEDEVEHSHHPFQSLKLHGIVDDWDFYCNVCQMGCRGFSYRCTDYNFKMDLLCSLKSKIHLPIHDYKLKLQVGNTETEPFFCDFCHTRCYSHRRWIKALKHSSIETEVSEYNTTGELTRMNWLKAGNNLVELSSVSLA